MYVIKKLKLNKFEDRPIVSNRALIASLGEKPSTQISKLTADCAEEPVMDGVSKTKLLGLAEEMSKVAYAKHKSAGESADMVKKDARDF